MAHLSARRRREVLRPSSAIAALAQAADRHPWSTISLVLIGSECSTNATMSGRMRRAAGDPSGRHVGMTTNAPSRAMASRCQQIHSPLRIGATVPKKRARIEAMRSKEAKRVMSDVAADMIISLSSRRPKCERWRARSPRKNSGSLAEPSCIKSMATSLHRRCRLVLPQPL